MASKTPKIHIVTLCYGERTYEGKLIELGVKYTRQYTMSNGFHATRFDIEIPRDAKTAKKLFELA